MRCSTRGWSSRRSSSPTGCCRAGTPDGTSASSRCDGLDGERRAASGGRARHGRPVSRARGRGPAPRLPADRRPHAGRGPRPGRVRPGPRPVSRPAEPRRVLVVPAADDREPVDLVFPPSRRRTRVARPSAPRGGGAGARHAARHGEIDRFPRARTPPPPASGGGLMDTRLRTLLHDLATEMPVDIEGTAPKTLRRARGRRILTGGAGAAIAIALVVVVSMSALRFAGEPTVTPAVTGPNSSATFEGLWPETDVEALTATQASIRDGHDALRTTPEGTATLLATNLLGWELSDVQWRA